MEVRRKWGESRVEVRQKGGRKWEGIGDEVWVELWVEVGGSEAEVGWK